MRRPAVPAIPRRGQWPDGRNRRLNLQYQYLVEWTTALSMFAVIIVFLILFEPRWPPKVYACSLVPFLVLWLGGNLYILTAYGIEVQGNYTLLTATLSSLLYFWIAAKHRGGRFFFTFCMVDTAVIWMMMVTNLIDYAVGGEGLVIFVLRVAALPVMIYVGWRFVRRPYLLLLRTVSRGWWLFAAMTGLFYVTLSIMAAIPTNLRQRPEDMPAAVMMLILLPLTYATIFIVLRQQDELFHAQERQHTFEIQSAMMEQRVGELRDAEDRYRCERHDMRHRLLAIAAMLRQEDTEAALDYIGVSEQALAATAVERYCANPALDAVLSSYIRQAEEMGIQVETQVDLPAELPVPAVEVSTVFANALENMIHAVRELPAEKRRMACKCMGSPCLMLEFSNPCGEDVRFGQDGLPVPRSAGHGIGTRSIAAFAEKYHAVCSFRVENGWFKLRLAL